MIRLKPDIRAKLIENGLGNVNNLPPVIKFVLPNDRGSFLATEIQPNKKGERETYMFGLLIGGELELKCLTLEHLEDLGAKVDLSFVPEMTILEYAMEQNPDISSGLRYRK